MYWGNEIGGDANDGGDDEEVEALTLGVYNFSGIP